MSSVISMHNAKTTLSQLVKRAASGEVILLGAYGKPEAKLVPLDVEPSQKKRIGILAGKLNVPEDFDAPLPDEILAAFDGLNV
ncbi:MAG: type II toxin-antitoxin system prevent-host-death family antitoxin [Sterolibacterium sp.]|nr:type II toxin-antitoxin system prevent-host-death family antitoxin [Sterolibacterium sp.]